ncbi:MULTISPECIES: hypothetical protein [Bradyrhizobium]|uniref:hypothetical protein n=1 Tax=Bradyrhizobium TaxID=374 RepID=UPI001EDBA158|nr:hypothetical protein [Bradyrhizobium zhengyangense]MCG2639662.1 hypothetical protein [Bradyrhizobium zhengyangense]
MTQRVQNKTGGPTFPRTAAEWQEKGHSPAQADHKMCQDVFGHDYRIDAKGYPIETGRGSAANPVTESLIAQEREKDAAEQAKMRLGWHKGLENAFDPRSAPAVR